MKRRTKMSEATGVKTARSMELTKKNPKTDLTEEQIRQRAYEIFILRDGTPGNELQDWL
jgi:hypothetical protein